MRSRSSACPQRAHCHRITRAATRRQNDPICAAPLGRRRATANVRNGGHSCGVGGVSVVAFRDRVDCVRAGRQPGQRAATGCGEPECRAAQDVVAPLSGASRRGRARPSAAAAGQQEQVFLLGCGQLKCPAQREQHLAGRSDVPALRPQPAGFTDGVAKLAPVTTVRSCSPACRRRSRGCATGVFGGQRAAATAGTAASARRTRCRRSSAG
jgi:hypothetical protein